MKRGCLIVSLLLLVVVILVAGFMLYTFNRQVGLFEAAPISHETVATPANQFRLVLRPEHLGNSLLPFLPDESELPAWLPLDAADSVSLLLPHEIALLSESNFETEQLDLTFFVNERRGGPVFMSLVQDANLNVNLKGFEWADPRFTYPQRGVLLGHADLTIPEGVEFALLERWSHTLPETPLSVAEGHLLAGVLDNRNGELLTLMLTLIEANDGDWQTALEDSRMETFLELLVDIYELHLHADLVDKDTLAGLLRVEANPAISPDLTFLSNMVLLPLLKNYIESDLRLEFSAGANWDEDEEALLIDFDITGLESWLKTLAEGEAPQPVAEEASTE